MDGFNGTLFAYG